MPRSEATAHIALVRGINVGTAKRVSMDDIRAAFAACGFSDAKTVLNSGNVVFRGPARLQPDASARIEHALRSRTGVSARVHLLSASELEAVVTDNPLLDVMSDPSRLFVHFLFGRQPKAVTLPAASDIEPDVLRAGRRALYQWAPNGLTGSRMAPGFWRSLGDDVTTRNWRTVLRLQTIAAA